MSPTADQEFVEYIVKAIVDTPDKVKTERKVDEMGVLIELTVDPSDMGKIIGKEGRTAKSVRTLLRVLGAKNNARVNLKIIEPEGGRGPAPATAPTPAPAASEEPVDKKKEDTTPPAPKETAVMESMDEEKTTPLE